MPPEARPQLHHIGLLKHRFPANSVRRHSAKDLERLDRGEVRYSI